MNHISFAEFLESAPCILGEGAVIERLRRNNDLKLDPYLVNSAFIYEEAKRAALETICRQYLDIGPEYGLPLLLSTPTWRASRERIAAAGYAGFDLNGDNFRFLDALRKSDDYVSEDIVQRIFSSATRRETLGKHLKGNRRGGELKIDWTKPRPRA
jgi:hypothetical protein